MGHAEYCTYHGVTKPKLYNFPQIAVLIPRSLSTKGFRRGGAHLEDTPPILFPLPLEQTNN